MNINLTRTGTITDTDFEDLGAPIGVYNRPWRANLTLVNAAGGAALAGFRIQGRSTPSAPLVTVLADADFATAGLMSFFTTQGPHDLPAGSASMVVFDLLNLYEIQLQAKVAAGSAALSAYVGGGG